jgi:RNA polymerase sigma factor (TIGR02999 family)
MSSITELLLGTRQGQPGAVQALYALLYPDIKRIASARLAQVGGAAGGAAGLDTTALVHEGFLRMAEQAGLKGESRGQFFAYVGQVLRTVVIDHLRSQQRDKRGGAPLMLTLSAAENVAALQSSATDLLALHDALRRMHGIDRPLYELLEMLNFTGLTIVEVAALRGVSSRTINRDLIKARALLKTLLGDGPGTH